MASIAVPSGNFNFVDSVASPYSLNGQFSPEIAAEEQALNRRGQLANLLLQRGLQSPQGQMAGRFYVAPHWAQGLAQLGSAAAGVSLGRANDSDRKALAEKQRSMTADAIQSYMDRINGTTQEMPVQGPGAPQLTGEGAQAVSDTNLDPALLSKNEATAFLQRQEPFYTEGPKPTQPTLVPPSEGDKRKALIDAMTSGIPGMKEFAIYQANQEAGAQEKATQRAFLANENEQNRLSREDIAKQQLSQAMMLGLISKDQRDQMQSLAEQQAADRASHNKNMEGIQRGELAIKQQQAAAGKVPPGYRQTADGNLEPIPGGPADLKLQGAFNADTAMLQNSNASFDRLATTANQILNHPGLAGITGLRGKVPDIPGSDAANARALLDTLKSQIGFGVLQEMRNNSKTGGALGAVSDSEGKRLENNLAALGTAQDLGQFKTQLQGIIDYANGAKDRLRDAFNMKHKSGEPVPMAPSTQGPKAGAVEGGYRFKGGDASKAENWEKVN